MQLDGNKTFLGAATLALLVGVFYVNTIISFAPMEAIVSLIGLNIAWLAYAFRDAVKKVEPPK